MSGSWIILRQHVSKPHPKHPLINPNITHVHSKSSSSKRPHSHNAAVSAIETGTKPTSAGSTMSTRTAPHNHSNAAAATQRRITTTVGLRGGLQEEAPHLPPIRRPTRTMITILGHQRRSASASPGPSINVLSRSSSHTTSAGRAAPWSRCSGTMTAAGWHRIVDR